MSARCGSCKHWRNPWGTWDPEPSEVAQPARWGTCERISLAGYDEVEDGTVAFTRDASYYKAHLHTRDDFGCVLYDTTEGADSHVMYLDQSFLGSTYDVGCSCGWDRSGYESRDEAVDDWKHHVNEATRSTGGDET